MDFINLLCLSNNYNTLATLLRTSTTYDFALRKIRLLKVIFLVMFCSQISVSQSTDTLRRELTIDLELRPRAEYRDNFTWTPADSVMPKLYVTQRNRLSITYRTNRLRLHASPQEIHVWGETGRFSRVGSVNFFEAYAEPAITKYLSVRVGRQAISLDNGRIFSAAPWGQQSRAHEGVRILFKKKLETDLTFAFTRPYSKHFEAAYSPVSAHNYKYLVVHHLKTRLSNRMTLTTINSIDIFRRPADETYYQRITNGGRLEYNQNGLYGTVNAYYQYGKNAGREKIRAYYIQPEVSANTGRTLIRLGAEILSGDKNTASKELSSSFVPLYGVAWKFMGNMNLFTRFPADVQEKGLVNPYLFIIHQAGKRLSLRADAHLFYSQYPLLREGREIDGKYLGFESDLSLNYKPVKALEIIYGFSFTAANKRMELLGKVEDSGKIPVWSYLMISFAPRLLNVRKTRIRERLN
ncbi:alginate export family protein [Dyadobacter sp. CY261]|uniref:alginate export family protein n=1 Tax=Dyadobacter sp. CY261 TaxID=2907203 RepID=UPI001F20E53A|nr:alginate export family protein [Dyadobacter sp. CY261]MCF0069558.1 alginate export family protein [Dyadobacter sp. CY261]